jgi:hypothetical protein
VLRGAYGASLRQLPFLPYLALRSLLYLGIILLVLIAISLPVGITRADIAFSLALSLGYNLLLGVKDSLGPGVLFAFVAGRYHHPRREERMLPFIDMRASTAIAERLGEERFLDFLNRFITDLSLAIAGAGGRSGLSAVARAYARAYDTSDQRAAELPRWLHSYNWHRPHGSIGSKPPHQPHRPNREQPIEAP